MIRKIVTVLLALVCIGANGQERGESSEQKSDTVIVSLARTSQLIFTMKDRSDLEILKHYDFQELFRDILIRLEANDTSNTIDAKQSESIVKEENENWSNNTDEDENDEEWEKKIERRKGRGGRTWQSFNFDLGTNNYITPEGKFPDHDNALHAVRPWGSWYLASSSIQRTRVGKNFFIEWGIGLSWYNFKFQNDAAMLVKYDSATGFIADPREVNHKKSKLSASYIHASFVPVIDFNDRGRKPRMWDGYGDSFRIGFGPYVGYRIASRTKMVYSENGHTEKEKVRDNFYLNNLRYGARLQLGFRNTDLFFNYDLNELFAEGKGPALNAFSFGVIF